MQCAETHSVLSELLKNFSAEKFSQKLFSSDFKRQRLRDLKKGCFESECFVGVSLRQTLNAVNLRSVLSSSGGFDCQFDRLSRLDSFCRHRIVSTRSSRARHAVSPLFFKSTRRFLTLLSAFFLSKPTVYFGLWCRVLDCRVRLICGSLCPA